MVDYCPNCGADDSYLEAYMSGETICTKCGLISLGPSQLQSLTKRSCAAKAKTTLWAHNPWWLGEIVKQEKS